MGPSAAAAMATCTWCTLCRCLVLLRPPVRDARFAGAWCCYGHLYVMHALPVLGAGARSYCCLCPACRVTQPGTNITSTALPARPHSQSPTSHLHRPACLPRHTASHQHHLHRPACQVTHPVTNIHHTSTGLPARSHSQSPMQPGSGGPPWPSCSLQRRPPPHQTSR